MNKMTLVVLAVVAVLSVPLGLVAVSWDCTRSADCVSATRVIAHVVGAFFVLGVLGSYAWSALGFGRSAE
ncbi:hypothetical protein [Paraburkholderia xenovorans]